MKNIQKTVCRGVRSVRSIRSIGYGLLALLGFVACSAMAAESVLEVYLARHGQTAWNLEKRLQGSTDNPLNDTGRQQARQLREKLSGINVDAVYSSSLVRAVETAALAVPSVKAVALPALSERSFGKFEGMSEEGHDAALSAEFKRRVSLPDDELSGGESLSSQARRVAGAIDQIRQSHPTGRVLIVSHGGVTPLILAHLLKLPVSEAVARIKQSNDEVYLVRLLPQNENEPQVFKWISKETLDQL